MLELPIVECRTTRTGQLAPDNSLPKFVLEIEPFKE